MAEEEGDGHTESNRKRMVYFQLAVDRSYTIIRCSRMFGRYIYEINSIDLGYYRVNYDEHNWNALINQLAYDHTAIHVLNRAQLINDAFKFATIGQENFTLPLRMSEYLIKESDIIPWYSAKREFERLMVMMRAYSTFKYFKVYDR